MLAVGVTVAAVKAILHQCQPATDYLAWAKDPCAQYSPLVTFVRPRRLTEAAVSPKSLEEEPLSSAAA